MNTVEQLLAQCRNEREARRRLVEFARANGQTGFEEALALARALHRWSCEVYYSCSRPRKRLNRDGRGHAYGLVFDLVRHLEREQIKVMVEAINEVEESIRQTQEVTQ